MAWTSGSLNGVGSPVNGGVAGAVQAADTIKVGVLHSLSGTMAISETTLKDTMMMLIDEQGEIVAVTGNVAAGVIAFAPLGAEYVGLAILAGGLRKHHLEKGAS